VFSPATSAARSESSGGLLGVEHEFSSGEEEREWRASREKLWKKLFLARILLAGGIPIVIGLLLVVIGAAQSPCTGYHMDGTYYPYACYSNTTCCFSACTVPQAQNACVNVGDIRGFVVGGVVVIVCGLITSILYGALLLRRRKNAIEKKGVDVRQAM